MSSTVRDATTAEAPIASTTPKFTLTSTSEDSAETVGMNSKYCKLYVNTEYLSVFRLVEYSLILLL